MPLFNRKLAVTTVKIDRNAEDTSVPTDFEKIGETIVNTTAGVGAVVVVGAAVLTGLRVTEHVVKYILK